jgi:hypothetical protein
MRGEFALAGRFTPPGGKGALAVFPFQALLPALFDPSQLVIVLRIVGTVLPLQLALQSPDSSGIGSYLGAEQFQVWVPLTRDDGERGGPRSRPTVSLPT